MKTDTQQKILTYITAKKQVSAKEIIAYLGLNPTGVFRHLKKLIGLGLIIKTGRPPRVVYLPSRQNVPSANKTAVARNAFVWSTSGDKNLLKPEIYCPTRDIFQARLDRLLADCRRQIGNDNLSFLLVAIIGEIGNNSFDHNLGNWRDVMGIYFAVDFSSRTAALADRGQGVFATIKKVKPGVKNDREALRTAFTEIISGRSPEQRGNGLKFVKKIIEEQDWRLDFYSGSALCQIKNGVMEIKDGGREITGTLAVIKF